uniref:Uncharacterized protein n=1 Tax=Anguilla anguilla TaxID=7936 RepID=A0A0E9WSC2_ANGAN
MNAVRFQHNAHSSSPFSRNTHLYCPRLCMNETLNYLREAIKRIRQRVNFKAVYYSSNTNC